MPRIGVIPGVTIPKIRLIPVITIPRITKVCMTEKRKQKKENGLLIVIPGLNVFLSQKTISIFHDALMYIFLIFRVKNVEFG